MIYSYYRRGFLGEVDFKEQITPLQIIDKERTSLFGSSSHTPSLFMKYGADGYNLGIIVPDWWWKDKKASSPKPLKEDSDYPTGQISLVLATIPYSEFDLYWEPADGSLLYPNPIWKKIEQQRIKHAWSEVEHPDIPELAIDWGQSIENKYFRVEHRAI